VENQTPIVSIVIPWIRKKGVKRALTACKINAGIPDEQYEFLCEEDKDRIGCPKMLKRLVSRAAGQMICFVGDDTIPQKNFLKIALERMSRFPQGWGLVGFNDLVHDGWLMATHWLAHKRLLPLLGGEFFHTGYIHTMCDLELTERCKAMGRYAWAEDAVIKHVNPIIDKAVAMDADYDRVYSKQVREKDIALYNKRKAAGFSAREYASPSTVVVGIPCYGDGKERFWNDLFRLLVYSARAGLNVVKIVKRNAVVEHARNLIVDDVLKRHPEARGILWIDADMAFPEDTLVKLLSHGKDIVLCNAYKKAPPYGPVVGMLDKGRLMTLHVPPSKGELRRVQTGGTGMCWTSLDVFRKVDFPWFYQQYIRPPEDINVHPDAIIRDHTYVSEDINFFVRADAAGFPVYCDFSIEIGHIGDYVYDWQDHEVFLAREEAKESERDESDHPDKSAALCGVGTY